MRRALPLLLLFLIAAPDSRAASRAHTVLAARAHTAALHLHHPAIFSRTLSRTAPAPPTPEEDTFSALIMHTLLGFSAHSTH